MPGFPKWFRHLPLLAEVSAYGPLLFRADAIAGLTVGIVLIPQAMAYAMLAGMPPIYGLYTAVFPLLIYAVIGGVRSMSLGPAALLSLLIFAGVSDMAQPGSESYVRWVIALAFAVGLLQFLLGIFRLGFLVNFLSMPVISGFTSASAILIMFSQIPGLLGMSPEVHGTPKTLLSLLPQMAHLSHGLTILISLSSLSILLLFRRFLPKWPGALFVLVLGIVLTRSLGLEEQGLRILGEIPRGLPSPSWPSLNWVQGRPLLPSLLSLSLMSFVISVAVARSLPTERSGVVFRPDRELMVHGLCNLGGSIFQCFPVAGSFARTALNYHSGAQTGWASVIAASLVLLTVLLFTHFFASLPMAVLNAIIVLAVYELFQWKVVLRLFRTDKLDLLMLLATFLSTLLLGMETGIVTGIVLSLSSVLYTTSRPHYAILGRMPGSTVFKNIDRYSEAEEEEGIMIFRPDARLFFGNQEYLREAIERELALRPETELIIVDGTAISTVDSTAVDLIRTLQRDLLREGVSLRFLGLIGEVRDTLEANGLQMVIGSNHIYTRINDLIERFREETDGRPAPRKIAVKSHRQRES